MAVCPGKVVVITSCRGYNNQGYNNYRNPFNVYLNDVYIGELISGNGDKGEGFLGTLDGGVSIPSTHPLCDGREGDFPLTYTYRFDDSIINVGLNTLILRSSAVSINEINNPGAGGTFTVILYEISGGLLVNPVTIHSGLGWATGGSDVSIPFQFACPGSPDINWLSTTPAGTTISPSQSALSALSALPCCECTATTPKPSTINSWIFTPPGVILGEPWYLSTTTAPDNVILTYDIATTTITTTPYITTTTIAPAIPTTPIPKKCKCKEKNCNYLGF